MTLKHKTFLGTVWKILDVGGRQLISLLVTTLLARLILPAQYGLVAMLGVFLALAEVFIDSGFSTALMRKTDRTQIDCSTVFWFNVAVSVFFYLLLFFCAPLIAGFYAMPELQQILRVCALSLVISGLTGVQRVLFSAKLDFKTTTAASLVAQLVSGGVGIAMAFMDFQVWALVASTLLNYSIFSLQLWFRSDWRPSWEFSFSSLRTFFAFGSRLLGSALLNTAYGQSYSLVIGKIYSSANLAFYNRAGSFSGLTSSVPTNIIESVTFPSLCHLQGDDERLRNAYRRMIKLCAFVVFPLCLGCGAVACPLINVLLSSRWEFAATLLQILVFGGMWYPIHSLNLNLLKVKGRSDLFFRLEIYKKIVGIAILCVTVPKGLVWIASGSILSSVLCMVINTHYTGKLLNLGFLRQMGDVMPSLLLSLAMFITVKTVATILGNGIESMLISVLSGVAFYAAGALLFRFPQVAELKTIHK